MDNSGNILVVDDSTSIRASIQELLSPRYAVQTADSGETALAVIGDFKPDVVLLDVNMGGMDGYAVCRRIRCDSALGYVKILMVSTSMRGALSFSGSSSIRSDKANSTRSGTLGRFFAGRPRPKRGISVITDINPMASSQTPVLRRPVFQLSINGHGPFHEQHGNEKLL